MGATTIAANSDYPYGDMYTSNSNYHLHGMQGANAMQGGSYMMQAMDMHMDVYDACMEMGYTSNVEAQELADVLRGILDEQEAQLSYTTSSDQYTHSHNSYVDDDAHTQCVSPEEASNYNALPSGLLHIHTPFSPLVDLHDSELLCIAKHHLAAPCNAEHLIAPFILDSDPQQMHNVQENPPPCIPSNGADALMPGLSLINHDNHHLDDANRTGMRSINSDNHLDDANHTSMGLINTDNHLDDANHSMEACSKPLVPMHHIDNEQLITLCWLNNAAADANYELSSSKGGLANPAACAHDQGALKIDAEICSDHHPHVVCDDGSYGMRFDHDDGFTKESNMDGDHASKEHMLCTPHPYPMSCDDAFYPRGLSAMQREAVYAAAALQPVDWASVLAVSAGARPKRRNVRISHDPQTVSARRRRERISDRIRVLQRLVPGGTKMDTASMLDEAIHYLKYLKSQVQALEWLERRSSISSSSSSCFYPNLNPRSLSNSRLIK